MATDCIFLQATCLVLYTGYKELTSLSSFSTLFFFSFPAIQTQLRIKNY